MARDRDGLDMLDRLLTGPVEESEGHLVSVRELPPLRLVGRRARIPEAQEARFVSKTFFDVHRFLVEAGHRAEGPGYCLRHDCDIEDELDLTVGVPMGDCVDASDALRLGNLEGAGLRVDLVPATRAACTTHAGAYDELDACERALLGWAARTRTALGEPMRIAYLVSPAQTQDPAELRTEL
jgi:effector-binding domain-containing protein